ncbi:hypothetical protein [Streptomyces sp. NPDC001880]
MRLSLGPTRDVVVIDGTAEPVDLADLGVEAGDTFAARTGPPVMRTASQCRSARISRISRWTMSGRNGSWVVVPPEVKPVS